MQRELRQTKQDTHPSPGFKTRHQQSNPFSVPGVTRLENYFGHQANQYDVRALAARNNGHHRSCQTAPCLLLVDQNDTLICQFGGSPSQFIFNKWVKCKNMESKIQMIGRKEKVCKQKICISLIYDEFTDTNFTYLSTSLKLSIYYYM